MAAAKFILSASANGTTAADVAPTQVKFTDLAVTKRLTDKLAIPQEGHKSLSLSTLQ